MPFVATTTRIPAIDRTLLAVAAAGALLWSCVALRQGYDFEWDVLNYHFYNGFALLHGRIFANVQPAMWQTYFSPLIDAVFYVLVRLLRPTVVLLIIAVFQSLAFPLLFQLARVALSDVFGGGLRLGGVAFLLALLGATAPVDIWEAGGALGDSSTAVLVLGALFVTIDSIARFGPVIPPRRAALAGMLAGLAVGLKLTNAPCALGVLCAAAVTLPVRGDVGARRAWARSFAACIVAMAGTFAVIYGWWGLLLWQHLGNPVFPSFNQFFKSPYAAISSYVDPTYMIRGWRAKFLFPFVRTPLSGRVDPAGLFDVRMAIVLPMCALGLITAALRRPDLEPAAIRARAAAFSLLVSVLVGYAGWLLVFPANRYLVAVDMVAPLACVAAVSMVLRSRRAAWAVAAGLGVALPASAYQSRALWWLPGEHRHGDAGGYFGVSFTPPQGLDGSVVAMLGGWPSTFVIPFFPRDVVFVRLQGSLLYAYPEFGLLDAGSAPSARRSVFGSAMGAAICRRLDENRGALFLLRPAPDTPQDIAAMTYFGVAQASGACTPIASKSAMPLELCPAVRTKSECS